MGESSKGQCDSVSLQLAVETAKQRKYGRRVEGKAALMGPAFHFSKPTIRVKQSQQNLHFFSCKLERRKWNKEQRPEEGELRLIASWRSDMAGQKRK